LKQSLLVVPWFRIHSRRLLETMAASDSPSREEEHSLSSQPESAVDLGAHGVGNPELEAGRPKASVKIVTAAAAKKSAKQSESSIVAPASIGKESTLQQELAAARARREKAKQNKLRSNQKQCAMLRRRSIALHRKRRP
jgi:hypothetical protein